MLVIKNLEAYYDRIQALKGITLHISHGEVVSLIGANGAGKTTTLHAISGLLKHIEGEILLEGRSIKNMAPEAMIRSGDYPREKGGLEVTVVLSEMSDVEKVRNYFTKAINIIAELKKRQDGLVSTQRGIDITIKDIPSLL